MPLTNNKPKALVPLNGVPMLELAIRNLVSQGAVRIFVNIHHFADMVESFLLSKNWGVPIEISDERPMLLDTGGALGALRSRVSMQYPLVVHNVDVVSQISVSDMVDSHLRSGALATLAVSRRASSRQLLFQMRDDGRYQLAGWHNVMTQQHLWATQPIASCHPFAFSGISVVDPRLLDLLPPAVKPYPIIPEYLRLAKCHEIVGYLHPADIWRDMGKYEDFIA